MHINGSDKGHEQGWGYHNYTTVYAAIFRQWRNRPLRVFELGLGTNDPTLASTMGVNGKPGASLRGWRDLFPRAYVYGADIDRRILFTEDRIKTFYCDQRDQGAIRELWSQPDLRELMDIIIDDGLHTFEANLSFLEGSLEHLRPGGIYVVEDILNEYIPEWLLILEDYSRRSASYEFALVLLPHSENSADNNLLIIRRQPA
jgi:hypothetical protein